MTLELVVRAGYRPAPLFVHYGQSNVVEVEYARRQAAAHTHALFQPLREVRVDGLRDIAPQCVMLTGGEAARFSRVSDVCVPARMPLFLSLAAMYMHSLNTPYLAVGVQCEGLPQGYPDASGPFIDQMEDALAHALGTDTFRCFTPLLDMQKQQIANLARALDINVERDTYSCLVGGEKHCGECVSCFPGGTHWRDLDEVQ